MTSWCVRTVCSMTLAGLAPAQGEPPAGRPEVGSLPVPATQDPAAPPAAPVATPQPAGIGPIELAQAMTATMRLATPGEPHRRLAALAGRFDVEMTLRPPGLEPETCTGQARAASVLGGRYLILNLDMRVQGARLEGLYVLGFDNLRGIYTASWRDSMSTWSIECSGPPDPQQQDRIAMEGTMVDAASPTGRSFQLTLELRDDGFEITARDSVGAALAEVMRQRFVRRTDDAQKGTAPPPEAAGAAGRDK